jgi:hypothetical protein
MRLHFKECTTGFAPSESVGFKNLCHDNNGVLVIYGFCLLHADLEVYTGETSFKWPYEPARTCTNVLPRFPFVIRTLSSTYSQST